MAWIVAVSRAWVAGHPVGAGQHRGGGHRCGQVPVGAPGRRGGRGAAEVTQARAVRGGDDGLRAERAVREAGRAQRQHRGEELGDELVADVIGPQVGQPRPGRQPGDQDGVAARPALAGRDHFGHQHAGLGGQQGQVGLVLDLLQPVDHQRGPGVAVHAEPPHLVQPLRVGSIAAVHGEFQRAALLVLAGESLHAPRLVRHRGQRVHVHPEIANRVSHLGRRGQPGGRAEGQVAGGRHAPAQHDG
jgi:hypothetical protein